MKNGITVVSVGIGDPDLLNAKTLRALRSEGTLILRTARHDLVPWLEQQQIAFTSMDSLYDRAEDFDDLCRLVCGRLFSAAADSPVVYAVTDVLSDRTVRALLSSAPADLPVSVIPGTGLADIHLSSGLSLLNDAPLLTATAYDLLSGGTFDPSRSLLVTELNDPVLAGQVKLFLSRSIEDEHTVYLIRGASAPAALPLFELDRLTEIDHLCALLVPASDFLHRGRFVLGDLLSLMERLRAPGGCPWDGAQTHQTLRPYLVEEAWECVAAIDEEDPDHLCEELGDLLFQVVFHSSIGNAFGEFTIDDVVSAVTGKMIRRHPHVFGDCSLPDSDSVRASWEKIKQSETGSRTVSESLDDVSEGLPSLKYAAKVYRKLGGTAAGARKTADVLSDLRRLVSAAGPQAECFREEDLGRLLLLCAELCFQCGQDGELLLHRSVDRLRNRIKAAEKRIISDGKSLEHLTFSELGVYLQYVEGEIE